MTYLLYVKLRFSDRSSGLSTASQPKGVAALGDLAYVIEEDKIEVFKASSKETQKALSFTPTSIAVSTTGTIAVGGAVSTSYR